MGTLDAHDTFINRLSDYLDGDDLSASERAAIEAHLATCRECRATLSELRDVAARARSMTDIPPASDLWPGIAARLTPRASVVPLAKSGGRRFSFTMPQLVAAGLALMVLSGGLVWVARLDDPRASLPPAVAKSQADEHAEDPGASLETARIRLGDADYDQAVSDLEQALDTGRSRLDPETVQILEDNLRTIDQAIDQARKALRNDPANAYLNNHLAASRNRKLALLRRASALAMAADTTGGS
jgi:anti-sigma factor RsiW